MKFYAGIGSRQTPIEVKDKIKIVVEYLNNLEYVLRSGGAPGADTFFENYAKYKEIFLPYKDYNNNKSPLFNPSDESFEIAAKHHPEWNKLSLDSRKLMARNCHQVLGQDLKTPVNFIVCWTKEGGVNGGTAQAIRIANNFKIPVYNLFFDETVKKILSEIQF